MKTTLFIKARFKMPFIVIKKRTIFFAFLMAIVSCFLAINFTGNPLANVFFARIDKKLPIYSVETEEKKVAISFDAAWGADKTEGIIELLNEFDVQATFFLVGFWVDEHKDKVEFIDKAGYEIGTHSNTHPDMALLNEEEIKDELVQSVEKIEKVTNKKVELFRPPYGSYSDTLISVADGMGLKTIQWDCDSLDWKGLSATNIASRVVSNAKNGSIILMHNNSDNILEGLRLVLSGLKQKGFTITSVGDIVYSSNYTINSQGIQQPI